jgi:beta-1,4-mannosyltransferase
MKVLHVPYVPLNPYQKQLLDALRGLGVEVETAEQPPHSLYRHARDLRVDVVHLHWFERFFISRTSAMTAARLVAFRSDLQRLRRAGTRIVWTVHNLVNHEKQHPRLNRAGARMLARSADAIIAHSASVRDELADVAGAGPAARSVVIPHGHYIDYYENRVTRDEARRLLKLPPGATVFLFFGGVRPYKGVPELIDAFRAVAGESTRLLIAGAAPNEGFRTEIERTASTDSRIRLALAYVSDTDVQLYMNAADLVVLPFRDITTSGSVILAMSFGRCVIAPRFGGLLDVLPQEGAFYYDADRPDGLAGAIKRALAEPVAWRAMGERNKREASNWDWRSIAERTLRLYGGGAA